MTRHGIPKSSVLLYFPVCFVVLRMDQGRVERGPGDEWISVIVHLFTISSGGMWYRVSIVALCSPVCVFVVLGGKMDQTPLLCSALLCAWLWCFVRRWTRVGCVDVVLWEKMDQGKVGRARSRDK